MLKKEIDVLPKTGGIYYIVNLINGKLYVGQAQDFFIRYNKHNYHLLKGNHKNNHLQNAVNLYGIENFQFRIIEILDVYDKKYITVMEQYHIDIHNYDEELYNKSKVANCGDSSKPVHQYSLNGVYINTFSSTIKASKFTGIHKSSITECLNGRSMYAGTFFWSHKVLSHVEINEIFPIIPYEYSVYQYTLNNVLIAIYKNAREANKSTGVSYKTISLCCRGKRNSSGGFQWFDKKLTQDEIDSSDTVIVQNMQYTIYQYDMNNNYINVFKNLKDASIATGVNRTNISATVCGRLKKAGGFIWSKIPLH